MSKLVLMSCAALALIAASGAARAAVLYDDTAGAAVAPGWTPGYESASYSGSSPAQEFTATGTGKVSSFSFEFYNASVHADPLTVTLWTTNAANIAFDTEIGSWTFNSEVAANAYTQIVDVAAGPLLTNGVRYGIELATSSTATSTDWLTNSNVTVENYSVCNQAFYCTDPNGLTPTDNSTYFTGNSANGPQLLYAINGVAASGAPEPGAWVMLLAGLGGVGAALRKARRRSGAVLAGV
ncbi:MAG TPA: PEP-CTERM sorting domain-containing protein [Caulobacteraceae bacterium]|nr:PEP-CTERM sorting domain-containing protein [Caulobacteraceae bacterium]